MPYPRASFHHCVLLQDMLGVHRSSEPSRTVIVDLQCTRTTDAEVVAPLILVCMEVNLRECELVVALFMTSFQS